MNATTLEELEELERMTADEVSPEDAEAETDEPTSDEDKAKADRAAVMKANRLGKLAKLFGNGRKFELKKKIKATSGTKYPTPLGNDAASGYLMVQTSGTIPEGWDPNAPVRFFLGTTATQDASAEYGCFVNADAFLKARKTRVSKADKEALAASRKADLRKITDDLFAQFEIE